MDHSKPFAQLSEEERLEKLQEFMRHTVTRIDLLTQSVDPEATLTLSALQHSVAEMDKIATPMPF